MPLPPNLQSAWDEAERTGQSIDIGRTVVCDLCNLDYTENPAQGGFIAGSYAYCPACAPKGEADHVKYGEQHLIRARAISGETFADFVRRLRGGNNTIRITKGNPHA